MRYFLMGETSKDEYRPILINSKGWFNPHASNNPGPWGAGQPEWTCWRYVRDDGLIRDLEGERPYFFATKSEARRYADDPDLDKFLRDNQPVLVRLEAEWHMMIVGAA